MRMTLYGMLQYDSTLFDGVALPEGFDANDLKDTIVERCGDLYPYYQVPERVKLAIQRFFLENYNNFDMMYKALHNEYNPIENTDWSEASTRNIENTDNGQDNRVIEGGTTANNTTTVNNTTTTNLTNSPGSYSETTNYTNAYNEGTGTERDRAKTVQGGTDSTTTTTTNNGTTTDGGTTSNSSSDVLNYEKTNNIEDTYSVRRHGNIGVQTTAQIITMELEMRRNNVYEIICDLFEKRICVQVY